MCDSWCSAEILGSKGGGGGGSVAAQWLKGSGCSVVPRHSLAPDPQESAVEFGDFF